MRDGDVSVKVYGTSHVSKESIEMIDRVFKEEEFEKVALELDPIRLNALLSDQKGQQSGTLFMKFLKFFQNYIGKKTGVMPGEEMLYAYRKAVESGKDVVLVDQDIRVTMSRFGEVSRKEKVKAVGAMLLGMIWPGGMDISRIPDDEKIQRMVERLEVSFPGIYRVLYEERNEYIIRAIRQTDGETVAFLGAAHKKPVQEGLK